MFRLLLALFGAELRHVVRHAARRAAVTALLFGIGAILVGVSLLAFLVGAFLMLAARYDPVTAALVIAAFTLLIGLIFLLCALLRARRRPARSFGAYAAAAAPVAPPAVTPAAGLGVPPGSVPGAAPPASASSVIAIAAGAALVGLILGRRI
ncbi:hypothetical protein MWN33_02740 [Starkeya koreensis]|uniref:Holin-X, holin superfamily III n=1 Tax=Ancylobacter koreensis TaxID=266121 RepID=A0ABT0DI35_9HYPH|nr:hypothetical protein [Ancylobacter koreensis]MCK0206945.1 hypothetical protein [Ancylobacter koreensis]